MLKRLRLQILNCVHGASFKAETGVPKSASGFSYCAIPHRVSLNCCKISTQTHARVYSCKILLLFVELNSISLGQSETEKKLF